MEQSYNYGNSRDQLALALQSSFIDELITSDEAMRPKLLSNNYEENTKVLIMLEKELLRCDTFMFSVAFVTKGGITVLKNALRQLAAKGVKGRILTSTYNFFNSPETFRELLKHEDIIDVRIYDEERAFHSKGYIFKREDNSSFIIGSSNLTQNALTRNQEWNVKMNSTDQGALIKDIEKEFDRSWRISEPLTEVWIDNYEKVYQASKIVDLNKAIAANRDQGIRLNKMQREALENLEELRNQGKKKAILISATGTGKTYLSAFDVLQYQPDKFLFVIHRENIARKAMESFEKVLGNTKKMALFSGNNHLEFDEADYIFATIQTLSKTYHLDNFPKDHFDYIVIDEVHRAGAETYQRILNHFEPEFLLGMSATPERMDGFNVVEMFDYNIAYEIRLQQAMAYDLLCPFHYFAIRDFVLEGREIDDRTEFNHLVDDVRIQHIVKNLNFFGHSGNRPRGLVFCSSKAEAHALSDKFCRLGLNSRALTGDSSEESRRIAIDLLEQREREGGLDYIFSVDIFNEGIDIPKVNQIVMLRPTLSSIIFIQQLGRGLRKTEDKDYVIVLDFIGNYQNNYMIPMALSGDRSYNKDFLRRFAAEGNSLIPGSSTINFDEVTKQKVYEAINKVRFAQANIIKKEYHYLKQIVGRVPCLKDFYEHGAIDPSIVFKKYKSYLDFLAAMKEESVSVNLSERGMDYIRYISMELGEGKRPHEATIVRLLMGREEVAIDEIREALLLEHEINNDEESIASALRVLQNKFLVNGHRKKFNNCSFLEVDGETVRRSNEFTSVLEEADFIYWLEDLCDYLAMKYRAEFSERYEWTNLSLYKKYTRKDVCRLLNWQADESSTMYGYKVKHNTCPIFVNYDKYEDISYTINYQDEFINRHRFSWMSRNKLTTQSKELRALDLHKESGLEIHLFVKKEEDKETSEFYYMGLLDVLKMRDTTIADPKNEGEELPIVNVIYRMRHSVREDIYDYITN